MLSPLKEEEREHEGYKDSNVLDLKGNKAPFLVPRVSNFGCEG